MYHPIKSTLSLYLVLRALRTRYKDSVDFIGWYTSKSSKLLKISMKDSFKQYIAYHEGWGNYKNYKQNKKVINLAKKVKAFTFFAKLITFLFCL